MLKRAGRWSRICDRVGPLPTRRTTLITHCGVEGLLTKGTEAMATLIVQPGFYFDMLNPGI